MESESERIAKQLLNNILQRTANLAELFCSESVAEEAIISMEYTLEESGTNQLVEAVLENVVVRAERIRLESRADLIMASIVNRAFVRAELCAAGIRRKSQKSSRVFKNGMHRQPKITEILDPNSNLNPTNQIKLTSPRKPEKKIFSNLLSFKFNSQPECSIKKEKTH